MKSGDMIKVRSDRWSIGIDGKRFNEPMLVLDIVTKLETPAGDFDVNPVVQVVGTFGVCTFNIEDVEVIGGSR